MSGIISDNVGRSSGLVKAAGGGGKIGQVVSHTKTDTSSGSNSTSDPLTWTDTGLTIDITPSATSSKIWLSASLVMGDSASSDMIVLRFVRDSTVICIGAAAGDRTLISAGAPADAGRNTFLSPSFIDSPSSTSAITYKIQMGASNNSGTVYLNRSNDDTDFYYRKRGASTLIAAEVLA